MMCTTCHNTGRVAVKGATGLKDAMECPDCTLALEGLLVNAPTGSDLYDVLLAPRLGWVYNKPGPPSGEVRVVVSGTWELKVQDAVIRAYHPPRWTQSIDFAMQLVPEGLTVKITKYINSASADVESDAYRYGATARTVPLAVCVAALRFRREMR